MRAKTASACRRRGTCRSWSANRRVSIPAAASSVASRASGQVHCFNAIVPAKIERWLVDKLLPADVVLIEECLNSGLLGTAPSALCFRHELARVAVETSLSEPVLHALHAQVLGVLPHEPARFGDRLLEVVRSGERGGNRAGNRGRRSG